MSESPTIANVIAQIAISGTTQSGTTSAPEKVVVGDMVELGLSEAEVAKAVRKAVELGVVRRTTGEHLAIAK